MIVRVVVVIALSFLQCFGTVRWVTGRASSLSNLCQLSPMVLFWNKWRNSLPAAVVFSHNVSTFKRRLTEFNFYRFFFALYVVAFIDVSVSLQFNLCLYFDDVSGCFYPFVNKID